MIYLAEKTTKSKKLLFFNIVKYAFFLVAIPSVFLVIFRCPYTVPFLVCDLCPVLDCPSKNFRSVIFGSLIGYVALARVDFCGKVCPLGTLNDIFSKIKMKISKKPIKLPLEMKVIFDLLKYTIFIFVIIALINGNPRFYIPIHAGALIDSIQLSLVAGGKAYYARLLLILGSLVLGLMIPRFWCRYVCPFGTTIQLTKKGITKVKEHKCTKCGKHDTN